MLITLLDFEDDVMDSHIRIASEKNFAFQSEWYTHYPFKMHLTQERPWQLPTPFQKALDDREIFKITFADIDRSVLEVMREYLTIPKLNVIILNTTDGNAVTNNAVDVHYIDITPTAGTLNVYFELQK
jgi:hypothetical protein